MKKEEWKPVPSKPGIMASSWGRILLPARTATMPNGGIRAYTPKPVYGTKAKAKSGAKHEYYRIFNKFFGNMKVHRLVCEAFHGAAPDGKPYVMHLDECALNNKPENLKWGSQKENLNAPKFIEYCKSRTGKNSPIAKSKRKPQQ